MAKMKPPWVPEDQVPLISEPDLRKLLAVCDGREFDERRDTAMIRTRTGPVAMEASCEVMVMVTPALTRLGRRGASCATSRCASAVLSRHHDSVLVWLGREPDNLAKRRTPMRPMWRLLAGPIVAVGALSACGSPTAKVISSTPPTSSTHPLGPTSVAQRIVVLTGVEITVPASWPLEDGSRTPTCNPNWPQGGVVFVGDQPMVPSCPAPSPSSTPPRRFNGIWLQDVASVPGTVAVTLLSGQVVREVPPTSIGPGTNAFFHGVSIDIGPATSAAVAASTLNSIRFDSRATDTNIPGACVRTTAPENLIPQRLTQRLVLNHGDIVLDPALPSDRPTAPPPTNTNSGLSTPTTEAEQLYLARYHAAFPTTTNPDGSLHPINANVLAWIVYSQPITTTEPGCGLWGVSVTDARTGAGLGGEGWEPGP